MRLDKLARQLKTHGRDEQRQGKLLATRLRQQTAEADRKIKVQIQALEDGIEPEIVTARIAELKADKHAATKRSLNCRPRTPRPRTASRTSAWRRSPTSPNHSATPHARSSARPSTPSACASSSTRPNGASRSARPSPRPSRTPSRTQKPSRRKTSKSP